MCSQNFSGITAISNASKHYSVSSFLLLATQDLQYEIETEVTDGSGKIIPQPMNMISLAV